MTDEQILRWRALPAEEKLQWLEDTNRFLAVALTPAACAIQERFRHSLIIVKTIDGRFGLSYTPIMMLRYALIAILMLLALPAWAGERVQVRHDELNFEEPFEQATKSVLRSLLNQALDLIENHIELTGNLQPNKETGEQQGHFQLKLYPQGKSQSDEHLSADLRFRSSPDNRRFSFDLNLPKEPSKNSPSSPDNTL